MNLTLNVFYFKTKTIVKTLLLNLNEQVYIESIDNVKKGAFYNNHSLIYFTYQRGFLKIFTTQNIFDIEINGSERPQKLIQEDILLKSLTQTIIMALPRFKVDYAHSYATQDQILKVEGKVSEVVELQMSTDAKQNEYLEKVYSSLNENGNADAILASAVAEYAAKNQEAVKSLQETLYSLSSKQEAITEDITGFYEDTKAGFNAIQGTRVTTL